MKAFISVLLSAYAVFGAAAVPFRRADAAAAPAPAPARCQAGQNSKTWCELAAFPVCNMTTSDCSLLALPNVSTINIVPGNNTHCLNSSSPFYFQLLPGKTDKLLIWFYGGGGCWSNDMNALGSCVQGTSPTALPLSMWVTTTPSSYTSGIFNRTRNDSIFADYTILAIHYCSGDLHAGNLIRQYKNTTTGEVLATVHQSGSNNTLAALEWVFKNIPKPKDLIIAGCSAGSWGAQLWANYIYGHYNTTLGKDAPRTAVVADGYAGIIPENQRNLFTDLRLYESPLSDALTPELKTKLKNGEMFFCELSNHYQDSMKNVTFAATQSAFDKVQVAYFNLLVTTSNMTYAPGPNTPSCAVGSVPKAQELTGEGLYNYTLALYDKYLATGATNFVPFIVNSTQHCWMQYDSMYEVNVTDHVTGKVVSMAQWLTNLPLGSSAANSEISTICDHSITCPQAVAQNTVMANGTMEVYSTKTS